MNTSVTPRLCLAEHSVDTVRTTDAPLHRKELTKIAAGVDASGYNQTFFIDHSVLALPFQSLDSGRILTKITFESY